MSKKKRKGSAGGFATFSSCVSTMLVLLLLGISTVFFTMAHNFSRQLREGLTMVVTVSDSCSNRQLLSLQKSLREAPYSRHVAFISKERGTREMNAALQDSSMTDFLGVSPICAEFEVYLNADHACLDSLRHYEPSVRAMKGVTDCIYPRDVLESLDTTIPKVGLALLGITALLAIISFSLINNIIRMNVYAQRYSIHTMKLVGARWGFIRRPFIGKAFRIGLVAVLVADGLIGGGLYALQHLAGEMYVASLVTPLVWSVSIGMVTVCGLLFTLVCAYFSINAHLRLNTAEMYLK